MEQEHEKKIKGVRKKSWIITAVLFLVVAAGYSLAEKAFSQDTIQETMRILSDAFFIPGFVFAGVGFLSFIASEGSFDMLVYSFTRFGVHNLIPHIPKAKYESFYEYKQMKDAKGRHWSANLLFVGVAGLMVSVLFLILYSVL